MRLGLKLLLMMTLATGCRTGAVFDTAGTCEAACPEGENLWEESDVPCSEDGGSNPYGACKVIEECGETIYCRTEGF